MSTINLLLIEAILCSLILIIIYKKYKVEGLYAYATVLIFLTTIMSLKQVPINNYDINLGIIPFVMLFTISNIIIQKKGLEETKRLLLTTISTSLLSYIIILLISYTTPSNINLFTNASYDNIFADSMRMYFANIVTLLYSLLLNNKLYYYLKLIKNNIIISTIFSSIIIQFIASITFGLLAFTFTIETIEIIKIIMIRYLISLIISLISIILIYITKYIKE